MKEIKEIIVVEGQSDKQVLESWTYWVSTINKLKTYSLVDWLI